jgi:multiple sugar transport system permease protein
LTTANTVLLKKPAKARKRCWTDGRKAAAILTPMIIWWILAAGFPMAFGFVLGFFEWRGVVANPRFIGIENFIKFFQTPLYREILWRTVWLGILTTVVTSAAGFGVALLMNLPLKARGAYRSLWYIPAVTSTVAISQVIAILIDPFNGPLTRWFVSNGWVPINFVDGSTWGYIVIVIYSIWKGVGGSALLWLAGLQCVEPVLYEAAQVDGANTLQKFLHITVPGLRPIFTFIVIMGMIGALQIYEPVAFITNGGPLNGTMVLTLKIVKDGFFNFNFGMAGTSSMVLAVISFAASATYYTLSRRGMSK